MSRRFILHYVDDLRFAPNYESSHRSKVDQISSGLQDMRRRWTKVYEERIRERDALISSLKTLALSDCKTKGVDDENPTNNNKAILEMVQRLQRDKDQLMVKLLETETREDNLLADNQRLVSKLPESERESEKQADVNDRLTNGDVTDGEKLKSLNGVRVPTSCSTDTEKELEQIRKQHKQAELEINKLREENERLTQKSQAFEARQSPLKSTRTIITQSKRTLKTKGAGLVKNNNDVTSSPPTNGVPSAEHHPDDVNKIASLESQIGSLKTELERSREDALKLEEKMKERQKEEEGGIKRQQQLDKQLAEVRELLDSYKVKCLAVQREFTELKKAYVSLKEAFSSWPPEMRRCMSSYHKQIEDTLKSMDCHNQTLQRKYRREMKLRKALHNQMVEVKGNIRVFCRVRPAVKDEGDLDTALTFDTDDEDVVKVTNRNRDQEFNFDKVFTMSSVQEEIFDEISPLVRSVLDGFNVCIFAYGQTGSGKTYTMEGPTSNPGINQRALHLLFEESHGTDWHYDITASVMEIYNETIRDLLNPDPVPKLEVKLKAEGGLHVPGLVSVPVVSVEEINRVFETGRSHRSTASTSMNDLSSRSHCLLCIQIRGYNPSTGSSSYGRLNLVDLAGSERLAKSQADGARLKEAQNINKSLACLGDVISALRNKQGHVPYRNSKLTYLLQDSLGGDSKTLMIIQASPSSSHVDETVCSLAFGQRVRSVEMGQANKHVSNGHKHSTPHRPSSLNLGRGVTSPPPSSLTSPRSPLSPRSPKSSHSNKMGSTSSSSSSSSSLSSSSASAAQMSLGRLRHYFTHSPAKGSTSTRSSSSSSS